MDRYPERLIRGTVLGSALLLAACGGGGDGGGTAGGNPPPQDGPKEAGVCGDAGSGINHGALMSTNCQYLSSYRLFKDETNPTANPAVGAVPYDLTTALFSDYTSKYRFVFLPDGSSAQYSTQEAFDFPVGTVISKTFALPADTAFRGIENETLLETRLLIRRESGWTALPYVWNADKTEAEFSAAGAFIPVSLIHDGQQIDFSYEVPDTNMCKQCHQFNDGVRNAIVPIGPKARLLNRAFDYDNGPENQLQHWRKAGILAGLPDDLSPVTTVPAYVDADASLLAGRTTAELTALAKGYLDVNCAHCHRPEGGASNTGLHLEYWRSLADEPVKHGTCKLPVAYRAAEGLNYDLVPGDASSSILHYRINTAEARHRMPEIGRHLAHQEGAALIAAWIDGLPGGCP
tara:strand:+ start:214307 stop:215518 length:1212 start_codon:yes stop_codon:yes gene_type:complete